MWEGTRKKAKCRDNYRIHVSHKIRSCSECYDCVDSMLGLDSRPHGCAWSRSLQSPDTCIEEVRETQSAFACSSARQGRAGSAAADTGTTSTSFCRNSDRAFHHSLSKTRASGRSSTAYIAYIYIYVCVCIYIVYGAHKLSRHAYKLYRVICGMSKNSDSNQEPRRYILLSLTRNVNLHLMLLLYSALQVLQRKRTCAH